MWDRPSQNRFCLVIVSTLLSGCDPGISKTPTPTSIETTINDAVTLGNNTSTRGSEKPTQQSTSDSAPIPNSATIDNSTNSTASRDSKVAVVPTPQKSIVTPSNEQLARWEQPDFDRMKMLACREWNKIGFVSAMAHTPDGQHYLLGGTQVTLWSLKSEAPEYVFLDLSASEKKRLISLSVSPDGKWFATGDSEGELKIWSLGDKKELATKKIVPNGVSQIAISPNGLEISTINYTSEVSVWSADKLEPKNRFKVDTTGVERIMYAAPDMLVVAGEKTVLYRVSTGKLEQTLSPGRYNFSMARTQDGKRIAFGDKSGLQLWDVSELKQDLTILGGFAQHEILAFSPDGKYLATASGFMIRIWDLSSNKLVQIIDAYGWAMVGMSWLQGSNALLVANELGQTRIWGGLSTSSSLGLKPMHADIAMPDNSSREPATPPQLLTAIDLRTYPKLPGAIPAAGSETTLNYTAPVKLEEAMLFYDYFLGKDGWSALPPNALTPGQVQYRKGGFMLSASFYETGTTTSINLASTGNYDARWAPKTDATPVEMIYESDSVSMYQLKADLIQIETNLLRKMHESGWTAFSKLHSSQNEQPDARSMEFLFNSTILRVSISKSRQDPSAFMVQCTKDSTPNSIPIPKDSGFVEFDGSTQPYLVATTSMSLDQARDFYDIEMVAQGWLMRERGRILKEDYNWLPYIRGQQDLTIGLVTRPDKRTLVRVGEKLENTSWQLAKPKQTDDSKPVVGIEVADFPILNASKSAKFDENAKSIEFDMGQVKLSDVAEKYTKQFASMGWTNKDAGVRSEEYTLVTFSIGREEIALRARMTNGNAIVNIQGDGLLWTKPLPGGKKIISYESWLRQNKHPASLDLLTNYEAEMRKIDSK